MDDAQELREYEVGFLVREEAAAQEVAAKAAQYGSVTAQGNLKRLSFAYPVGKETSGYFGCLRLRAAPGSAAQLEKDFGRVPSILRFLVIRLPVRKETADAAAHVSPRPRRTPRASQPESILGAPLTNEALERKIEEILQ
ncbi:MAG: 30S ribosomal protein S6 [Candidatus Liptonbacteria bacterium]|nr:30S ribosomal protein S6 [Candidatus Liptonbacteria bacterium]